MRIDFGACSFRFGKEDPPGPDSFGDRKAKDDHQTENTLTQCPHRSHLESQCVSLFSRIWIRGASSSCCLSEEKLFGQNFTVRSPGTVWLCRSAKTPNLDTTLVTLEFTISYGYEGRQLLFVREKQVCSLDITAQSRPPLISL